MNILNTQYSHYDSEFHQREKEYSLEKKEVCIDVSHQRLEKYTKKIKERIFTVASNGNGRCIRKITKSKKTEMGTKTTLWIFQATNCKDSTRKNLD